MEQWKLPGRGVETEDSRSTDGWLIWSSGVPGVAVQLNGFGDLRVLQLTFCEDDLYRTPEGLGYALEDFVQLGIEQFSACFHLVPFVFTGRCGACSVHLRKHVVYGRSARTQRTADVPSKGHTLPQTQSLLAMSLGTGRVPPLGGLGPSVASSAPRMHEVPERGSGVHLPIYNDFGVRLIPAPVANFQGDRFPHQSGYCRGHHADRGALCG